MRPNYSAALHDLLEEVVDTSGTRTTAASRASRTSTVRTVVVTSLVATTVIGITAAVLIHAPAPHAADAATPPTPSITTPAGIDLGLVPWTDPEALANPTRLLTVVENRNAVPSNPNSCGITLVIPSVTASPAGLVTIALHAYGTENPPRTSCTDEETALAHPELETIVLNPTIHVRAVIDPATHTTRPLGIAPLPNTTLQATTAPTPGDVGVEAYPVPAGTRPRITARQAVHTCLDGGSVCGINAPDTITLALVTNPDAGPVDKNGKVTPTVVKRLAYVLTWRNQTCVPSGPAVRPGTSSRSLTYLCTNVAVVDATSGNNLFSYSHGRTAR